jgi:D-glycero-alpha-D-manno-heptose-7-phosphate kinase
MSRWRATAPIRICDAGGWTDTWFAEHGLVVNVAVEPRAEATVTARARDAGAAVRLHAADFGDEYEFDLDDPPNRHPLLEQCIAEIGLGGDGVALDVQVRCDAPAGASTGTSAAVSVALLAACSAARGLAIDPQVIAQRAHVVETDRLGLQAGIQDQLASAHGGVSIIEMDRYPHAVVRRAPLSAQFAASLDASLVLVYLGTSHVSSDVHRTVIAELEQEGSGAPRLDRLRRCAAAAREAIVAGDLYAYARALVDNTDAQAALAPGIVGDDAAAVIDLARTHGALGWKVNGAGGPGGSVTALVPPERPAVRDALVGAIGERAPWQVIPTRLAVRGVDVRPIAPE